jgi:sugar phosphate isomerase/epimerase
MILLTQDKPFFPSNFDEKFELIKKIGFDGYEIDGGILLKHFSEIELASKKNQLPIMTICGGYHGWIGDFNDELRKNGLNEIKTMLEIGKKLGIKGIVLPAAWGMFSKRLPPMIPPRSDQEDINVLTDSLKFLDEVAEKTSTTIYLEPLNRYEDHMLNHISDAAKIIEGAKFKHVKICYDFFHMNIEESKMDTPIEDYSKLIGHIHLASSHRYQPGTGHLDYQPGLKALKKIGYNDAFAFECRVSGDDLVEEYRKSVLFIRQEFIKAGF